MIPVLDSSPLLSAELPVKETFPLRRVIKVPFGIVIATTGPNIEGETVTNFFAGTPLS
jgi:hypothetical protein